MGAPRLLSEEEDRAEVEVLQQRVKQTAQLNNKIQASLSRLTTTYAQIQEAVEPIYGNTRALQTLEKNIGGVIEAIDSLRRPLNIIAKEEKFIQSGVGRAGLSEFLSSIKRLSKAAGDLNRNNLRSSQDARSHATSLLRSANQQLESVFRDTLREDTTPVEPLYYITKEIRFPIIPEEKISRLALISAAVKQAAEQSGSSAASAQNATILSFAEVRGPYMTASLSSLATACINTSRKRSPESLYKRGENGIGMYSEAVKGLVIAEHESICRLFTREDWSPALLQTTRGPLTELRKTLDALNNHIKANLSTDCFLAYEIVEYVFKLATDLAKDTGELRDPLLDFLRPIRDTSKQSLEYIQTDIRQKVLNLETLPLTGAPVSLTSDVMMRLQALTSYQTPLSALLQQIQDTKSQALDASSPASLFCFYLVECMDTLLANLESRAKSRYLREKSPSQTLGVFLANNISLIDRAVHNSDLQSILSQPAAGGSGQVTGLARIDTWRQKSVKLYGDAWKEAAAQLMDITYTSTSGSHGGHRHPGGINKSTISAARPASGANQSSAEIIRGLSSKDKDAIKEKFKAFNEAFADLVERHKKFVMERDVRSMLAKDVQGFIEPLYSRFYDKYHEIDRGKGKYVKYDKAGLNGVLVGLS